MKSVENVVPLRKQKRLNVYINQQTEEALAAYSAAHQVTVTEAVRRHIGVAHFILDALADGAELLVRRNGQTERLDFRL